MRPATPGRRVPEGRAGRYRQFMPEDRRARLTRLVADEIRRLAPEGGVGVAVDRQTGGNAGWSITVRLGDVTAGTLLVGSDEDPYALSDAQFTQAARHLLADARRKAARGGARSGSLSNRGTDHAQ